MNKKGFTLIELLAVIIILGILMIIAIPSVTRYINDSRKSTYIDTAKQVASATKNIVNSGKLEMYDTDVAYFIPNSCIKIENGDVAKSPYGEFIKDQTYVVVTYNGDGYDYYWLSLDETGIGIPAAISVDDLNENNIETNLKTDDIRVGYEVAGKKKIGYLDKETCSKITTEDAKSDAICKRATKLHEIECTVTNGGCLSAGYSTNGSKGTNIITYGSKGTKGELHPGDAFDCDVNGNGIFDDETERFYYIDANENNYILVYSSNTYNGNPTKSAVEGSAYSNLDDIQAIDSSVTVYDNWHGPVTAYKHLPNTSQWSSSALVQYIDRQILNENGGTTTNNGENTISKFTYTDRPARLLTVQELKKGANNSNVYSGSVLYNYPYLLENTQFDGNGRSYWLETPRSNKANWVIYVDTTRGYIYGSFEAVSNNRAIRPVIEVPFKYLEKE